jgi:LacI family transcriptional regulator
MREIATTRRRHVNPDGGPTLHDVARMAGVSTASASRALSRPDLVSEELRDRVMAAIHTLAYVPNAAAQTLSGRPARLVGAVISTLDDPVTMLGLEALTRELAARGVALVLTIAGHGAAASEACVRGLVARGTDAIVFCGGASWIDTAGLFPSRRVACASLDDTGPDSAKARSGFDRAKALALAARYLQQLGHVQVGFLAIGGDRRVGAVRHALAGTGIDIADNMPAGGSTMDNGAGEALDHWRAMPSPPTALICGSDASAVAVLHECDRRDIAVPAQLSVIGFGDTELSRHARPALSTLRVPARETGRALARSLLATLDGQTETPPELFAKVVARESTAAGHA